MGGWNFFKVREETPTTFDNTYAWIGPRLGSTPQADPANE